VYFRPSRRRTPDGYVHFWPLADIPISAWSIFHSAASNIDTGAVDRLKAIDSNGPIREADITRSLKPNGAMPTRLLRRLAQLATILRMRRL
jgi:hypothetical protein